MTDNTERDLELAAIEQKADRGEHLSADELSELIKENSCDTFIRILDRMKASRSDPERKNPVTYTQGTADGIRQAVSDLLVEMTAIEINHVRKFRALED